MAIVQLTTEVPTLSELLATDLSPFDGVYLGHPYCRQYRDNLITDSSQLAAAVTHLKDLGLKAYVSTDAAPTTADLPQVRTLLQLCADLGVDGIDVQNLGVLRLAHRHHPDLTVFAGGFINIYTLAGAEALAQYGVEVIRPAFELNLDEIDVIGAETGLDVELLAHGKIPLGITDRCLLLDYEEESGLSCPDICREEFWLKRDDWTIRHIGTVLLSGKAMCMLEHLPDLLGRGYRRFRVGSLVTAPAQRGEIGRIYREALAGAPAPSQSERAGRMGRLEEIETNGLCNGYFFGKSGHLYVDYRGIETGIVQS